MSSDFAIRVSDVTKHYLMFERPEHRLKQMIVPRLQRLARREPKRYYRDFAALNGVSFEVKRGETIGIIGRNGSGKSTLLQMVCGTLQPSSGTVEVNGRIAALLELGAGFNPEFTGRENVYMNAAILGLSRAETEARFERIAAFADIGMFLDQPVKTYSSGMYVRLAFATAINVDPDILVVDEALSVGDEAFQRKCFARIEDIKDKGGTILLVSHGAQTIVQLCDRAILIDRGEKILEGRPKTVVSQYQRLVNLPGPEAEPLREAIKAMDGWALPTASQSLAPGKAADVATGTGSAAEPRDQAWFDPGLVSKSRVDYESRGARIRDVRIETLDGRVVNVLDSGRRYRIAFRVDFDVAATAVAFGAALKTASGFQFSGLTTRHDPRLRSLSACHGDTAEVAIEFENRLNPGVYFVNCGVRGIIPEGDVYLHRVLDPVVLRVSAQAPTGATDLVDLGYRPSVSGLKAGTANAVTRSQVPT